MSTSTPDRDQPRDANAARNAETFRLTIAHLLLWTAATAFVVSVFPQHWLRTRLPPFVIVPATEHVERQRLFEKWSIVAVSPFYGVAVASVVIAGSRLLQRRAGFPSQPGHWLLVQTGLGVLAASCFRFPALNCMPSAARMA
jgi:hypothetical protein